MLILAFSWKLHSSLTLNFPTPIVFPLRLFHHPSLYKHFHKQHHEWTAPIGVVSIYAHPLEHMVNDRPPVDLSIVVECTEWFKENATLGVYCGGSTRVCRCLFRFSPGWVTAAAAVTDKSSRLHFHIRNLNSLNSSLNMKEYLNSSRFHSFNPEWMNEWTRVVPPRRQISNMLPVAMGPVLLGSHVTTTTLWYCLALVSTTISHCGYHLPLLPSPEFHDFHHLRWVHLSSLIVVIYLLNCCKSVVHCTFPSAPSHALKEILYILHRVWWIISHCASRPSLNYSCDNAKLLLKMYIFTEQSQGVLSLSGADLSNMKLSYKKQLGTVDFVK